MMKKFIFTYLIWFIGISVVSSESYMLNFNKIGNDTDYLVFYNETDSDLIIKYSVLTKCNICEVARGDKIKIKIGIKAEKKAQVSIPVTFEAKTLDGKNKELNWSMNGKHNDINVILTESTGWTF